MIDDLTLELRDFADALAQIVIKSASQIQAGNLADLVFATAVLLRLALRNTTGLISVS